MGQATFVVIHDEEWRFDPALVFDALREAYAGKKFWQGRDTRQLTAEGFADGWEVNLNQELTSFIVEAPPAPMMKLVAWVRAYVPRDVDLLVFDDQLTFEVRPLPVGITAEQLRSDYWPDAWKVEQMSAKEPPTLEERMRSGPPPHVVELMNLDRPPTTDPDQE
jgi:hypothetical protein